MPSSAYVKIDHDGKGVTITGAPELEASAEDIVPTDGKAHAAGDPESAVTIERLAAIASDGAMLFGRGSADPPEWPSMPAFNPDRQRRSFE